MLNGVRLFYCFAFAAFAGFFLCATLVAQPQMLPGQIERQSMSGGLVFRCLFDRLSDAENSDGWPDYWTRKEGIDNGIRFPPHIVMGNTSLPNPFGGNVFRINMEGGAACVFSPKIPVRPGMSYTVSAYVEASDLVFDEVSILAAFYGKDAAKPIRVLESKKVQNTNGGWIPLTIGPIPADMPNVQSIAVGLLVMHAAREDYGVRIHFTNVEIREIPSITLEMANAHHLFFSPRDIDVRCQFRGLDPRQHSVVFILEDHFGRVIGSREMDMMIGNFPAARFVVAPGHAQDVILGTATWKNLPTVFPGFYRVRVVTPESYIKTLKLPPDQTFDDPLVHTEPLTFAVLSQGSYFPGGEFGWTLDGWSPNEITQSLPTLEQSGLSFLKLPLWLSADTAPEQRETLLQLCKNLSAQQVRLIGLLSPAPREVVSKITRQQVHALSLMQNDPRLWGDSLQPSLHTWSLLVKDWQWTSDTDPSLIDMFFDSEGNMPPSGADRFRAYHKLFDQEQFGFGIGMTWNWYQDVPKEPLPIPNFSLNFPIDASVDTEDAAASLYDISTLPFHQSISISSLPADDYALDVRITSFVQSLVLMKAVGIDTISLTAPKDEQTGVLRNDGTPGELYLPWRTTATLLSGSRLLGSITLPNRSRNYCFDRGGGKCIMVVWNDEATPDNPVQETLYLGNELDVIDVWGKRNVPEQIGNNQTISASQTPIFVTGLNINVVRFRLSMQTGVKIISSKPNQPHEIPFLYRNDSAYPISIQISPQGPRKDWTISPLLHTANLEAGVEGNGVFNLTVLPRADTGRRLFQYDIRIAGTEPAEFSVYDEIMIGNPDVFMEFVSQLTPRGDLDVIQVFINNTENVYTYNCRLTIPNRQTQSYRVTRQGFGRVEHVYTIPRGQALFDSGVSELVLFAAPVNDSAGGAAGEPMVYTIPIAE
ncbi:MAG: hypothetical protein LBI05_10040 [Planctomycetaceae bacterium]|jgi:hypothetical protein|nr:hypothetical protein [Planctomycetaceae bacterium]